MVNFLTKKRKIFPNWLESKVTKIVFPIILGLTLLYFFSGALQTLWQQFRCTYRDYTWFSIPPSGKISITEYFRDLAHKTTEGHYREEYLWGICADMTKNSK